MPRSCSKLDASSSAADDSRALLADDELTISNRDESMIGTEALAVSAGLADDAFTANFDLDVEFGGREQRIRLERKLLRKVDMRMTILIVIYILNYMDRNNISAARLEGFEADLHLTDRQFDTLLGILYVGYIVMQIPSNMLLNHIGKPSLHIPICIIIWGFISCLTGWTTDFKGALATRFLLGFVEAAFFPGALFLLSRWYTREELGLRTALLMCGNLISNAFGSLFASGILSRMQGVLGLVAWRWLFLIEGSLTVAVGLIAIFVLPDFPQSSRSFLSEEEAQLAVLRIQNDIGEMGNHSSKCLEFDGLKLALRDWRTFWLALTLASMVVGLSFNAFFPTITAALGYSSTITLLLCAPPWVFATATAFVISRHSDRAHERCFHIIIPLGVGILGFVIAMSTSRIGPRYFALFLMAQSYTGFVCFLAWVSNSIPHPSAKRAVAIAFINAFSQLGNITGSYIWPKSWGPLYHESYSVCIMAFTISITMCLIFRYSLSRINSSLERKEAIDSIGHVRRFRYIL